MEFKPLTDSWYMTQDELHKRNYLLNQHTLCSMCRQGIYEPLGRLLEYFLACQEMMCSLDSDSLVPLDLTDLSVPARHTAFINRAVSYWQVNQLITRVMQLPRTDRLIDLFEVIKSSIQECNSGLLWAALSWNCGPDVRIAQWRAVYTATASDFGPERNKAIEAAFQDLEEIATKMSNRKNAFMALRLPWYMNKDGVYMFIGHDLQMNDFNRGADE